MPEPIRPTSNSSSAEENYAMGKKSGQSQLSAEKLLLYRLQERKYFDSGDYAMAKVKMNDSNSTLSVEVGEGLAECSSPMTSPLMAMVGRLIPSPEKIVKSCSAASLGRSPMKDHMVSSDSLHLLNDGSASLTEDDSQNQDCQQDLSDLQHIAKFV